MNRLSQNKITCGTVNVTQNYTYQNSATDNQTFPLIKQVTRQVNSGAVNTTSYTYDSKGNILTIDDGNAANKRTYTYDDLNQLLTEVIGNTTTTYTYDNGGNITKKTVGDQTTTWTYGDGEWHDLLTSFNGRLITYDAPP